MKYLYHFCWGFVFLMIAHAEGQAVHRPRIDTSDALKALQQAVVYRNLGWTDSALTATARAADCYFLSAQGLQRQKDLSFRSRLMSRSLDIECLLAESLYEQGQYQRMYKRWKQTEQNMQQELTFNPAHDAEGLQRERIYGWLARISLELDSLDAAQRYAAMAEQLYTQRTQQIGHVFIAEADTGALNATQWYKSRSFAFQPQSEADSLFLAQRPILQYARPSWSSRNSQFISFQIDVTPDGEVEEVYEIRQKGRRRKLHPVRKATASCLYKWRFLPDPNAETAHTLTLSFRFDRP